MNIPILILFAIFYLLIVIVAEKKIRNKLGIHKKEGAWYKTVNSIHLGGEILIIITFILVQVIIGSGNTDVANWVAKYGVFLFFTILYIFRAYMEWKFDRQSKEYIIQIFSLVTVIGVFFPALILFFS
jgi:hypothetical protein